MITTTLDVHTMSARRQPRSSIFKVAPYSAMCIQTLFLRAVTAKAFTTVLAGFALMVCILPKISLVQALVASFLRVLIMTKPGRVNLPVVETSFVPISARSSMILAATDFLSSCVSASCAAMAPLVIALTGALAAAFMGAMLYRGGRSVWLLHGKSGV